MPSPGIKGATYGDVRYCLDGTAARQKLFATFMVLVSLLNEQKPFPLQGKIAIQLTQKFIIVREFNSRIDVKKVSLYSIEAVQ